MNDYYCKRCDAIVPAAEVELLETCWEGEYDDHHLKCGGIAVIQLSSPPVIRTVQEV